MIRGCCKKCKLLKDGKCKDGHEPYKRGTMYVCGYQKKPYKEKAKDKTSLRKSLKKELWKITSLLVRNRDKKCILCQGRFPIEKLHAHHFIHTDASSAKYRYDLRNLVSLCYSCHIHKIHSGSMAHIRLLEQRVVEEGLLTKDELESIAQDKETVKLTIEDYEQLIKERG